MIKKRQFGKTDIKVSEIGLGGWQLGGLTTINGVSIGYSDVSEQTTKQIITRALELGIDTFDTADSYSLGNSERRLGEILKENRSNIHIFTKGGDVPSYSKSGLFETDLSYNHLIAALRRSLNRLGTDYVDLFQAHSPPMSENDYESIEKAFIKIKSDGMARYCGVSIGLNYEKGIELIKRGIVDSLQLYFSLINFKPIKKLLPLAKKNGIGVIVAEPLEQGLLTNKYKKDSVFPTSDMRSAFSRDRIKTRIEKRNQFNFLLNNEREINQVALSYVLNRYEISTTIPGVNSVLQLESNIKSSEIKLSLDEFHKIENIQKMW